MYVNGFVKKAGMLRIMHDRTRNKTARKKVTAKGDADGENDGDDDLEKAKVDAKGKRLCGMNKLFVYIYICMYHTLTRVLM